MNCKKNEDNKKDKIYLVLCFKEGKFIFIKISVCIFVFIYCYRDEGNIFLKNFKYLNFELDG